MLSNDIRREVAYAHRRAMQRKRCSAGASRMPASSWEAAFAQVPGLAPASFSQTTAGYRLHRSTQAVPSSLSLDTGRL